MSSKQEVQEDAPLTIDQDQNRMIYLFLENPCKSNNLGPVLRCASAFGIRTVVAVGHSKCAVEGSHGASNHVEMIAFPTSEQAATYLRDECGCRTILGLLGGIPNGYESKSVHLRHHGSGPRSLIHAAAVREELAESNHEETARESIPVGYSNEDLSFGKTGNVAVAVSKHADGLPFHLAEQCDAFLHVPHAAIPNNESGLPSPSNLLDLPSTLSIALHHLAISLAYHEGMFEGHKFHVARNKNRIPATEEDGRRQREDRANKRMLLAEEEDETRMGFGAFVTGAAVHGSDY